MMDITMAEAKINDIDIHYRVYGEGEPLLLIMGLGGNADWWDPGFVQPFMERFQVVTFDNRGVGRSSKPKGPYSISIMASDAVGLMDHLGWESANVMGVSMGGMVAQEIALTYPERVRRLVLGCTSCGGSEQVAAKPEVYNLISVRREGIDLKQIVDSLLRLLFPPKFIEENPELIERVTQMTMIAPVSPASLVAQITGIIQWSAYPRLGELRSPTLVMTGSEDILIPPENSRILADAIPDSRLVEIPGGGHGFTAQYPDIVTREILDFLT